MVDHRCIGLILAGGRGLRMGGADKALLTLGGHTLLDRMMARLAPQVDQIIVAAGADPERIRRRYPGVIARDDGAFAGLGPLAGILAGLRAADQAGVAQVLSVPVDTVFVPADLRVRLGAAPSVVDHGGRVHHLVALWPGAAAASLAGFLAAPGAHRVRDFAALIGMRPVRFDDPGDPFTNINTLADLAAAESNGE
jgi:molybdopterin-guanine dinucleotide biosynthesis protein A